MTRVIIPCRYELAQQIRAEHSLPRRHPWRVFLILLLPPQSREVWHGPVFRRVASALPETATTWCAVTNATLLDPATYTNDFRGQRSPFLLGRSWLAGFELSASRNWQGRMHQEAFTPGTKMSAPLGPDLYGSCSTQNSPHLEQCRKVKAL